MSGFGIVIDAARFAKECGVALHEWSEPWTPTAHLRLDLRPNNKVVFQQLHVRTALRQPTGYPSQREQRVEYRWFPVPLSTESHPWPETGMWQR